MYTQDSSSFISIDQPSSRANGPIGMFDSGIGGLTVAYEVLKYLPNEDILYYADTAHVPYGDKTDEEIRQLTAHAIDWLYQQGCKVAIVACNSASAFSLDSLRKKYGASFPIIGLVPAVKPAVIQSKSKVVGVLATPATFRGKLIHDVIENFAQPVGADVIPVTCLQLVPLIEDGKAMSEECLTLLKGHLDPLLAQGADQLVLGCTHYPFLKPAIEKLYGSQLNLIDSGLAVARQCGRILQQYNLYKTNIEYKEVKVICVLSGNNGDKMHTILQKLFLKFEKCLVLNLLNFKGLGHAYH